MNLPAGWALHPEHPQYMYELANPANVQPVPAAPVAAVAPAPTPQPTAIVAAPVVGDVGGGVPFWIWLMLGLGVLLIGASLLRAYRLYYRSE